MAKPPSVRRAQLFRNAHMKFDAIEISYEAGVYRAVSGTINSGRCRSSAEAVGRLVMSNPPAFGLKIRWDDEPEDDEADPKPLVLDKDVSEKSPVVRGTSITASRVVGEIIDGKSWADVIRAHPQLTEADVRACLIWGCEQNELDI